MNCAIGTITVVIDFVVVEIAGDGSNGKVNYDDNGGSIISSGSSTPCNESRSRSASDATVGRHGLERDISNEDDALHLERRVICSFICLFIRLFV